MIVSSLKKKNNSVEIIFEDGSVIVADYNVVVAEAIRKNDDLSEEKINYLLNRSELNKIKNYAFRFLGIRNHSSRELKLKLIKKKFPVDLIDEAISELISQNLIDDKQFAKQFLDEKLSKGKSGPNKIKAELIKKGIERKIIDELILSIDNDSSYQNALNLAMKKFRTFNEKDKKKSKQKIFNFLHTKGFDSELILSVLKEIIIDEVE
jgi:regulatory protein